MTPEEITELRQQKYNATVVKMIRPNEDLMIVRARPDSGVPSHKPGQYTTLGLGYWEPRFPGCQLESLTEAQEKKLARRAYSISCSILDDEGTLLNRDDVDWLEFYIVLVRESDRPQPPALTPRLFMLREGDRLSMGPKITGNFTADPVKPDDTVIFLSTGTGEAPHNYISWELLRNNHQGKIISVCCVRYRQDLGYLAIQEQLSERYSNYEYIALTTREKDTIQNKVYIQDLILNGELERRLGEKLNPESTHVYLCGNPSMIGIPDRDAKSGALTFPKPRGVIEILHERGFVPDQPQIHLVGNVHYEKYW